MDCSTAGTDSGLLTFGIVPNATTFPNTAPKSSKSHSMLLRFESARASSAANAAGVLITIMLSAIAPGETLTTG
jgi:hypothetical protein